MDFDNPVDSFFDIEHLGLNVSSIDSLNEARDIELLAGARHLEMSLSPVHDPDGDRIGTVIEVRDVTEEVIRQQQEKVLADANARIKVSLDSASTLVLLVDNDGKVAYSNMAMKTMLHDSTESGDWTGKPLSNIHTAEQFTPAFIGGLSAAARCEVELDGRHFNVTMSPVVNGSGDRIGTTVEWTDVSEENIIQNEIDHLIDSANQGNLDPRIDTSNKQGVFKQISEGLNTLMDTVSSFIGDLGNMLETMSKGDLTTRINQDYAGEFKRITTNANEAVQKIGDVMASMASASTTVYETSQSVSNGARDLNDRTASQSETLTTTTSDIDELAEGVKQTAVSSEGAKELASDAMKKAKQGGEVVTQAIEAMGEIYEASKRIVDITSVIDGIAFQTNLLALNAAVEAARAGNKERFCGGCG